MTNDARGDGPEASDAPEPIPLGANWTLSSVLTFPAATAVVVGLLYGVGALTRAAQLSHEGVPVSVALPLIPLTEDLARGIQVLVEPAVLFAVVVLVLIFLLFEYGEHLGAPEPESESEQPAPVDKRRKIALIISNLVLLVLVPIVVVVVLVAITVFVVVLMLSAPEGQRFSIFRNGSLRTRVRPFVAVVGIAISLASAALLVERINPPPLPSATLTLRNGQYVKGKLITVADGIWYLTVRGARSHVRAIDASEVTATEIVGHAHPESLGKSLPRLILRALN